MKHLKTLLLAIVVICSMLLFASCEAEPGIGGGTPATIKRVYINDDKHAIVEYTDGTTEDLGYVGVEVEVTPPKYTVTYLDAFGAELKVEKVYKGDASTPPEAPEISEKAFDKWDTDLSSITSDVIVRPVYVDAVEYTVTFLDETGALIGTDTVIHGKGATAPTAPKREDTIFKEWDIAFDSVKSDLTVKAVYREKNMCTVTFKDYSGLVLGTASVKEEGTVTAPVIPTREGYEFSGWSSSLSDITSNKTVTAKYTLKNTDKTVVDLAYTINGNGTVTLTATATGKVKFAGINGYLLLPAGCTNATLVGGDKFTANIDGDKAYFVYGEAFNTTAKTTLFTLTFKSTQETLNFDLVIESFVAANEEDASGKDIPVDYIVIGENLKLK